MHRFRTPRSKQAVSDTIPQPPPPPPPPPPPQDVDDIGRFARMDSLHDERVERTELLIDKIKSHCKARLIRTAVLQIIVFVDGSVELERIVFREGYDDDSKQLLESCIQEYLEQEQPNMGPLLMKKTARARPTKILWTIPLEVD